MIVFLIITAIGFVMLIFSFIICIRPGFIQHIDHFIRLAHDLKDSTCKTGGSISNGIIVKLKYAMNYILLNKTHIKMARR